MHVTVPITLSNRGFFALNNLYLDAKLINTTIPISFQARLGPYDIPPSTEVFPLELRAQLDLAAVTREAFAGLIFHDQRLIVSLQAAGAIAPFITVSADATLDFPWGAAAANLTFAQPQVRPLNATHMEVRVPFSFQNHSPMMTIEGTLRLKFYDAGGRIIVVSQPLGLMVQAGDEFKQEVVVVVENTMVSLLTARAVASFETAFGEFTQEVVLGA